MAWAYEGIQCYVATKKTTNHTPLYRSWNGKDHFYTANKSEYNGLPKKYKREGIACYIAKKKIAGHVPLYRLYKGKKVDDHFYTTSAPERDRAVKFHSYKYEGVAGYVTQTEDNVHKAFYRAWNPKIGDHFYTTKIKEIDDNGPSLSASKLKSVLRKQLKKYTNMVRIYAADAKYFCPTEQVAKDIIKASKVAQRRYIREIHDCDDFAHLLKSAFIEDAYDGGRRSMPYAFGILWGSKPAHAMNFIVTSGGSDFTVRLIEPQNGKLYYPKHGMLAKIYLIIA